MDDLIKLAQKIPNKFVLKDYNGFAYTPHYMITQYLLAKLQKPYEIQSVKEVYDEENNRICGAIVKFVFTIDDKPYSITEVGEVDSTVEKRSGGFLNNNAALLKHAISDALKRASRHLGLGLQNWAQHDNKSMYFLDKMYDQYRCDPNPLKTIHMLAEIAPKHEYTQDVHVNYILDNLTEKSYEKMLFLNKLEEITPNQIWAIYSFFGQSKNEDGTGYIFNKTAKEDFLNVIR